MSNEKYYNFVNSAFPTIFDSIVTIIFWKVILNLLTRIGKFGNLHVPVNVYTD